MLNIGVYIRNMYLLFLQIKEKARLFPLCH